MDKQILTDAQLKLKNLHSEGFDIVSCTLEKDGKRCKIDSTGKVSWLGLSAWRAKFDSMVDWFLEFTGRNPLRISVFILSFIAIIFHLIGLLIDYQISSISSEIKEMSSIRQALTKAELDEKKEVFAQGLDYCKQIVANDVRGFIAEKQKPIEGRPGKYSIKAEDAVEAEEMFDKGIASCQQIFFVQIKMLNSQ